MSRAFWQVSKRQPWTFTLPVRRHVHEDAHAAPGSVWHLNAAPVQQANTFTLTLSGACHKSRKYDCTQYNFSRLGGIKWSSSVTRPKDSTRNDSGSATLSDSTTSNRVLSRNIIVTGGTSGIGYHVARRAILEGANHVRIITRDTTRGQETLDRLHSETSRRARLDFVQAEAEDYADPKLFHSADIDTVIHCAGITQTSLLASTVPTDIHRILYVNLESAALLAKSFLKRHMKTTTTTSSSSSSSSSSNSDDETSHPPQPSPKLSWHFLAISSLLAQKAGAGSSVYAASKAGLIALTRSIALEAAQVSARRPGSTVPRLRANVVVPGYIETPMIGAISRTSREALCADIPAGRFGSPDEVADAVLFLCANEYANNCVLNLDGGLSAT